MKQWIFVTIFISVLMISTGIYIWAQFTSHTLIVTVIGTIFGVGTIPTALALFQVVKFSSMPSRRMKIIISVTLSISLVTGVFIGCLVLFQPKLERHPFIGKPTPITGIPEKISTPTPTETPIPSKSPTVIPKESPTATQTETPIPTPSKGDLVTDSLNKDDGLWDLNAGCNFTDNAYHINAVNFYQACAYKNGSFSNAIYQVHIVLTEGSVGGFAFRSTDAKGYYYFSIGWNGDYIFQTVDSQHQDHGIISSRVAPNSQLTYDLVIVANNSSFEAYINNKSISLPNDSSYTSGFFFLFVDGSPFARTKKTQAIFSDLKISAV